MYFHKLVFFPSLILAEGLLFWILFAQKNYFITDVGQHNKIWKVVTVTLALKCLAPTQLAMLQCSLVPK